MGIENSFTIIGRLVRDPAHTQTKLGTARTFYVVATQEYFTDRAGQRRQRADFIPVTSYGQQAVNDLKYLHIGKEVAVQGRIRQWFQPDNGQGGFEFEAESVRYLGAATAGNGKGRAPSTAADADSDVLEFVAQMDAAARSLE